MISESSARVLRNLVARSYDRPNYEVEVSSDGATVLNQVPRLPHDRIVLDVKHGPDSTYWKRVDVALAGVVHRVRLGS